MARNKRTAALPEGDDGRTIVDMNVEGMPWYTPGAGSFPREGEPSQGSGPVPARPQMSRQEGRMFLWGALGAALLVVGVMCAGLVLFVLFCQWVWLR